jgi:uncharacterized protein YndB with AHSA1/START domain
MTIAPVLRTVTVKALPERAFEAFTANIGQWWPKEHHTIGAQPAVALVIEPRVGGRWFERSADGVETQWGKVLAWDPPGRVLLTWQINANWTYDVDFVTELELSFVAQGDRTTLVTLEHRNMERFGATAQAMADMLGSGWPGIMQSYADYASA